MRHIRLIVGGAISGLMAGAASAGFLVALDWATDLQSRHPALLLVLPVAGVAAAAVLLRWGGNSAQGNRLTMGEIHEFRDGVPARMAPMVLVGTITTHLFGGSAGREGTALQMAAGLTDGAAARFGTRPDDRRLLLIAALAAGFGSVFGVPWAGLVFALEVAPTSWRNRLRAAPSAAVAAFVGDAVVRALGVEHSHFPRIAGVRLTDVVVVALVSPAFGIAAWGFIRLTDGVRHLLATRVARPEIRPALGGVAVVALTLALGTRRYNGLSLDLLHDSFGVIEIGLGAWLAKLVLTSLTVGSGFAGGEVTPLFVIGATLGSAVGTAIGGPVVLLAAVGMMATFGSAVNASLACAVMGVELFGPRAAVPLLVACGIARLCSSGRTLYAHQRVPEEAALI